MYVEIFRMYSGNVHYKTWSSENFSTKRENDTGDKVYDLKTECRVGKVHFLCCEVCIVRLLHVEVHLDGKFQIFRLLICAFVLESLDLKSLALYDCALINMLYLHCWKFKNFPNFYSIFFIEKLNINH